MDQSVTDEKQGEDAGDEFFDAPESLSEGTPDDGENASPVPVAGEPALEPSPPPPAASQTPPRPAPDMVIELPVRPVHHTPADLPFHTPESPLPVVAALTLPPPPSPALSDTLGTRHAAGDRTVAVARNSFVRSADDPRMWIVNKDTGERVHIKEADKVIPQSIYGPRVLSPTSDDSDQRYDVFVLGVWRGGMGRQVDV